MSQLDELTRRALCAADQPPPGVEDRILAAILGPGGGPGPDGGGSLPEPSAALAKPALAQSVGYAAKVVGATIGLTAGGVVLLALTGSGIRARSERPPSEAIAAAVDHEAPAPGSAAPIDDHADPPPSAPERPIVEPPPESAPTIAASSSTPTPRSEPAPTLEAELALMKVARESGDPERALAALERHQKEFAAGVFAAEREVLRVEQLCALGRTSEAEAIARAFVTKHPDNPLRSRVDPACAP